MYKHLYRGCKEEGVRFFSVVPRDVTRASGHKLKHRRCCMNTRRHTITGRVTEHWSKLPRETIGSSSLEIVKSYLDMILDSLLSMTLCELDKVASRGPCLPPRFCDALKVLAMHG